MSYRTDIVEELNSIADEVETIHDELVDILDIDNIEDIVKLLNSNPEPYNEQEGLLFEQSHSFSNVENQWKRAIME